MWALAVGLLITPLAAQAQGDRSRDRGEQPLEDALQSTPPAPPRPEPNLPVFLRDRGTGTALSMFGSYAARGELIIYPYWEYYRDGNREYAPNEFGFTGEQDFRGSFRASEGLFFVAYGITDRLAIQAEIAGIRWEPQLGILFTLPIAQSPSLPEERGQSTVASAPTSEAAALPALSSLFRDLARDVRRLPSLETGVVLGVAGATTLGLRTHDRRVTTDLASSLTLDRVFETGEIAGGSFVQAGAAVATLAVGRLMKSPKAATVGADLVRGQILTSALTHAVKFSVRRVRPDGGKYSFPSGHSSASFTSAAVLGRHFGWKAGVPAYTLAAYVAASRLQENRHFLTDVAFGAAIGVVAGRTVTIGRGSARFVASPVASTGVAGVAFTWIGALQPRLGR